MATHCPRPSMHASLSPNAILLWVAPVVGMSAYEPVDKQMDDGSSQHHHAQAGLASGSRDEPLSWSVEAPSVEHKHSTVQRLPDASPTPDGAHLPKPPNANRRHRSIRHHKETAESRMPKQTMSRYKQVWDTTLTVQPMLPPASPSHLTSARLLAVTGNTTPKPHPPSTRPVTAQQSPACPPWHPWGRTVRPSSPHLPPSSPDPHISSLHPEPQTPSALLLVFFP